MVDCHTYEVCSSEPLGTYYWHHTFHKQCKLKPDSTYTLSCHDSYGDGWNGGYIEIQGHHYCGTTGDNKFTHEDGNPKGILKDIINKL